MASNKERLIEFFTLAGILVALILLVPSTLALFKGGFDDPAIFEQFLFYVQWGIGFLLGILFWFALELLITKDDAKFGNSLGFSSRGEFPAFKFFKRFTGTQILFLSVILFSFIALLNVAIFSQTAFGLKGFTGVGTLEKQQFTAVEGVLFSTVQVPTPENLGAGFVIATALFFLRFLGRKYNWTSSGFRISSLSSISILVGLFGVAWHSSVYPGSEIAKLTVFFFWTIGAFLTLSTGDFRPFLVMHTINNLLVDLARFFAQDVMTLIFFVVFIGMLVSYFFVYRGRLLGKK